MFEENEPMMSKIDDYRKPMPKAKKALLLRVAAGAAVVAVFTAFAQDNIARYLLS